MDVDLQVLKMETLIDIRHCLKILLVIVLVSNILIGVSGENEDFTIDSLPTNEKAVIPRLRSPQLIPDRNVFISIQINLLIDYGTKM